MIDDSIMKNAETLAAIAHIPPEYILTEILSDTNNMWNYLCQYKGLVYIGPQKHMIVKMFSHIGKYVQTGTDAQFYTVDDILNVLLGEYENNHMYTASVIFIPLINTKIQFMKNIVSTKFHNWLLHRFSHNKKTVLQILNLTREEIIELLPITDEFLFAG